MVGDLLSRSGILERHEDGADRRRTIVTIAGKHRADVEAWLAGSAHAWRKALVPLAPEQRQTVTDALRAYEREVNRAG